MVDYLTLCVMIPTLIYWIFTFHRACYPCGSSPRINMTNYVSRACGYTCAVKCVDHERCVAVSKTGCAIDGEICVSLRQIMKSVGALVKKHVFHYENIASKKMPFPE